MDAIILNRAAKAKKLDKYLELFSEEKTYEQLKNWKAQTENMTEEEERTIPKKGEILICGYPALSGSVLLTKYYEEELGTYFPKHFIRQILEWEPVVEENLRIMQEEVQKLPDAYTVLLGESGLHKVLYQLGKDSGMGFTVFHEEIPVRQESIEVCEFFDLDPWSLFSAGSMMVVMEHPGEFMEQMKRTGIVTKRVGYMMQGKDKFISHKTIDSRVNRPEPDGILRVLQSKLIAEEDM